MGRGEFVMSTHIAGPKRRPPMIVSSVAWGAYGAVLGSGIAIAFIAVAGVLLVLLTFLVAFFAMLFPLAAGVSRGMIHWLLGGPTSELAGGVMLVMTACGGL